MDIIHLTHTDLSFTLVEAIDLFDKGLEETIKSGEHAYDYGVGFSLLSEFAENNPTFNYGVELNKEQADSISFFYSFDYMITQPHLVDKMSERMQSKIKRLKRFGY